MAILGGVAVSLFGAMGAVSVAVAMLVALGGQRMPYSSLLGVVAGYGTLVALSVAYDGDTVLAMGVGGMACLVLAHALVGHRRRRHASRWEDVEDLEEAGGATDRSGLQ